ncbi:MAG TPA: iron ABC transporter permease [bacterium]|nr:iron ABC transporter permease [bacterium]
MTPLLPKSAVLAFAAAFFLGSLLLCPLWGSAQLSFHQVFQNWPPDPDNQDAQIFFAVRLPRVFLAALAGAAMAACGVVFQAVLRNPLACPFTLGVAGGSSFGAVAALALGLTAGWMGLSWVTVFAFLGALLSVALVYALASVIRSYSAVTLLLAGVGINYFFNALVLLFYFLADFTQSYAMMHWLMGSLDVVEWSSVKRLAFLEAGVLLLLFGLGRDLNLLAAGEELAQAKGVPAPRVIVLSVLAASLLTSAVVAIAGPIAFVGLIVPHVFRIWVGNDHRVLLAGSALGGAAFLMICDTVARSCFGPTEIPVGVLTAILGVPVLLFLLFRRRTYLLN